MWLEEYRRVCRGGDVVGIGERHGGSNTDRGGGRMCYVLDREVAARRKELLYGELMNVLCIG